MVANDDASLSVKAKRPLKEARVDVQEDPRKPGVYRADRLSPAALPVG